MSVRTEIIQEVEVRISGVDEEPLVLVNSPQRVTSADFPAVEIVTYDDDVTEENESEDWPLLDREWPFDMCVWIKSTEDESKAPEEVEAFQIKVTKALFEGGTNLGGKVVKISQTSTGLYVRPPGGEPGIGLITSWMLRYQEDLNEIMTT